MINSDAGRIANGEEYLGQRRSEEAVDEEVNHSRTLPIVAATITLVRRGPATAVPGAGFSAICPPPCFLQCPFGGNGSVSSSSPPAMPSASVRTTR